MNTNKYFLPGNKHVSTGHHDIPFRKHVFLLLCLHYMLLLQAFQCKSCRGSSTTLLAKLILVQNVLIDDISCKP